MPQFLLITVIFVSFKNPHFCLFPGVLHGKLKFQDKYYNKIDYNKWSSSEKQDEKCVFRNHVLTRFNLIIIILLFSSTVIAAAALVHSSRGQYKEAWHSLDTAPTIMTSLLPLLLMAGNN